MINHARITFSSNNSPFFLACFKKVARSPSRLSKCNTLTKFHDNDKCAFEIKGFNVFDDKHVLATIAEFL